MQQIILAVQTPRAGKWNHRWIVPAGCQTDDITLKDTLSRFDSLTSGAFHRDGIVFCRSVEQTTSGRSAREFIFLYFPDFYDKVTAQGKNHCYDLLRAFFESQMDQMVTSIDWDNTDGTMIYQSPVLVSLYKNLERVIQQNQVQTNVADDDINQKRGGAGCWCFMLTLVLILSALYYFNRGSIQEWLNQHLNQSQEVSENDNGKTTPVQTQSSPSSDNTDNTSGELNDGDYEQWQKLFTLPPNETDLHKRYEMVQAAVHAAYKYYHHGKEPTDDDEISISKMNENPNSFADKLYKARDTEQPYCFSSESGVPDTTFTIKPAEFREAIYAFHIINETTKQLLEAIPIPTDYVTNLITVLDNPPDYIGKNSWEVSGFENVKINPNFFFDSDKTIIAEISDEYFNKVDEQLNKASSNNLPENEKKIINDFRQKWNEAKNKYFAL